MSTYRARAALVFSLVLFLTPLARAGAPATEAAPTFVGEWQTSYGKMKLSALAGGLAGTYGITGVDGTIEGTLDATGKKLTFKYIEPGVKGEGWFELSADGKAFAGKWRPNGAKDWQDWAGKRVPPPDTFTGLWRTNFGAMRIVQEGKAVRGTYQMGAGSKVTGEVDGRTAKFTYQEPGGAKGEGTFTLSADGQTFAGTWKQTAGPGVEPGKGVGGKWEGTRAVPKSGIVWLVVLEARWERGMDGHEYSYGEMLKAYFTRVPWVQVRHRFITDEASVRRWCEDVKFIAEPVVLYFSSHGTKEGLTCDGKTIGAQALIECVKDCDLKLLHFGACDVAGGDVPRKIIDATGGRFPISGFTKPADWGGSAVVDFAYLDLVLARGMGPKSAADQVKKMISFARENSAPGDAIEGMGLVVAEGK